MTFGPSHKCKAKRGIVCCFEFLFNVKVSAHTEAHRVEIGMKMCRRQFRLLLDARHGIRERKREKERKIQFEVYARQNQGCLGVGWLISMQKLYYLLVGR